MSSKAETELGRGTYVGQGADGTVFFLRTNQTPIFSLLTEDYRYGDGLENAWMKTSLNGTDMVVNGNDLGRNIRMSQW